MSGGDLSRTALRVLIVDTHEVSRAAVRALLQTEGVDVVADVSTGEQALALASDVRPDVVIIDAGQNAPRALELANALSRSASLPVIVLTSSAPVEGGLDGYSFLAKPDLSARELRLAMRSAHTDA